MKDLKHTTKAELERRIESLRLELADAKTRNTELANELANARCLQKEAQRLRRQMQGECDSARTALVTLSDAAEQLALQLHFSGITLADDTSDQRAC